MLYMEGANVSTYCSHVCEGSSSQACLESNTNFVLGILRIYLVVT